MLPPFLHPLTSSLKHPGDARPAVYDHGKHVGKAHSLWWAPRSTPDFAVLFIPGNPGLIEFYTPFLDALHKNSGHDLAILAQGHIDHNPIIGKSSSKSLEAGLTTQVQSAIESFDALRLQFTSSTKIVVIGHSVGAWIATQVLKERRSEVTSAFLLFPTLSHIGSSPNGRRLWRMFTPGLRWMVSTLGLFGQFFPIQLLALIFPGWPQKQLRVLKDLIGSPRCISATLKMAHDEMNTIKDPDLPLLDSCRDKLRFYYAIHDGWVGAERENLLKALDPLETGRPPVTVTHDEHGIPHAFCINHGDHLAKQCSIWLDKL